MTPLNWVVSLFYSDAAGLNRSRKGMTEVASNGQQRARQDTRLWPFNTVLL